MNKLHTCIFQIVCAAGIALSPSCAFAAIDLMTFHVNPNPPGPMQAVVVSLQSYAVDLDSAKITWYVDKTVVADGIAEKSIQTMTKEFGQTVTINAVILTASGVRYDKQLLLKPIEVDLLWEADTITPPFYKGKALPTYKSIVKLGAIPRFNARSSDPSAYSYTWTANQTQGLGGGFGKNTTLVEMKYSGSAVPVHVEVAELLNAKEGGMSGSANKNIRAVDPLLLFYEDAPLLGLRFNRALSANVETKGTSFTLHAVPYFFSTDDMWNAGLVSTWQQDGQKITPGTDPNILIIEKSGASAQSTTIELSVQNRKRVLQAANAAVGISFSAEQ